MDITSSSNKLIKEVKTLNKKRERYKKSLFFIEGIKIIEDAIESDEDIRYILYSDRLLNSKDARDFYESIKNKYEIYIIDDNLFDKISDTESPQGILAVLSMKEYKIEDMLGENPFILVLDQLQDPGNMGTIIRSADAMGATGIIVSKGSVDIYNPKVGRSTMGSLFHLPIIQMQDTREVISILKEKNIRTFSTTLEDAKLCYNVDFKEKIAIIIGNEASGLDEDIYKLSDENIIIPMEGKSESLNAAMASSIIMYEVLRQRRNI